MSSYEACPFKFANGPDPDGSKQHIFTKFGFKDDLYSIFVYSNAIHDRSTNTVHFNTEMD